MNIRKDPSASERKAQPTSGMDYYKWGLTTDSKVVYAYVDRND